MHCFTKSYKILLKLLPKIKILLHYKVYLDISCPDTNRQNVDHRKVFLKKHMNSPMPPPPLHCFPKFLTILAFTLLRQPVDCEKHFILGRQIMQDSLLPFLSKILRNNSLPHCWRCSAYTIFFLVHLPINHRFSQ